MDGGTGGRSAGSPSFGAHGLMGGRASRRFQAARSAGQDGAQESGFYSSWPSSTPSREASRALSFGRSPAPFDLSSLRLVEQRQGEGGEEESGRPGRASGQARSSPGHHQEETRAGPGTRLGDKSSGNRRDPLAALTEAVCFSTSSLITSVPYLC